MPTTRTEDWKTGRLEDRDFVRRIQSAFDFNTTRCFYVIWLRVEPTVSNAGQQSCRALNPRRCLVVLWIRAKERRKCNGNFNSEASPASQFFDAAHLSALILVGAIVVRRRGAW
jgi:hypothetical protein